MINLSGCLAQPWARNLGPESWEGATRGLAEGMAQPVWNQPSSHAPWDSPPAASLLMLCDRRACHLFVFCSISAENTTQMNWEYDPFRIRAFYFQVDFHTSKKEKLRIHTPPLPQVPERENTFYALYKNNCLLIMKCRISYIM